MLQKFERDLREFHKLFDGGRCTAWQLEELFAKAINSDTSAHHHAIWNEGGHNIEADITVSINTTDYKLQIKSGSVDKKLDLLVISGYRLGRFGGDLGKISQFLNTGRANIISTPYEQVNDDTGRKHIYTLCYIDSKYLQGVDPKNWQQKGKQWLQNNNHGVEFSLRPAMSWQIWWKIPMLLVDQARKIQIG